MTFSKNYSIESFFGGRYLLLFEYKKQMDWKKIDFWLFTKESETKIKVFFLWDFLSKHKQKLAFMKTLIHQPKREK